MIALGGKGHPSLSMLSLAPSMFARYVHNARRSLEASLSPPSNRYYRRSALQKVMWGLACRRPVSPKLRSIKPMLSWFLILQRTKANVAAAFGSLGALGQAPLARLLAFPSVSARFLSRSLGSLRCASKHRLCLGFSLWHMPLIRSGRRKRGKAGGGGLWSWL